MGGGCDRVDGLGREKKGGMDEAKKRSRNRP